ncbi:GNAT family N-acetyltransferase [Vagococcus xieshaowenii]|uniref:GNAT family N-acetyltransferase n=2 Tax=Vagococcus xieshaowenii TaxID=2562451 RepID=A0A4Z0D245_9ENTE|nr:GNAT family N-acetyltransferase [Vagococcus xieshaowenii]TFZ39405.1 GNAT family N-acetyltransferase [Vagococcus xieshaowenii]
MTENLREKLVLRQLDEEHIQQFNELLAYVFQITDADIEESGFSNKRDFIKSKQPILELSKVFGWFDDEELVSQIAIYPCEVNIHGTIYQMGGVTGVGTYPEYASHGLMQSLIMLALEKMREDGQWISYLYPYNIPYYRRKGWEIMSDKLSFDMKDTQLPTTQPTPGYVEREAVNHPDVYEVYESFARQHHGAMLRSDFNWEEYWRYENQDERTAAIYYGANQQPLGVLFYWIAADVFHVKEMFTLNEEARQGLWHFINAHFSMVDRIEGDIYKNEPLAFLLDDGQIKETIEPYYMARIVDVAEFLREFPFAGTAKPFHFEMSDPVAKWNNGIFSLSWDEEDHVQVGYEPIGAAVKIDIQTFTCLFMNYRRAAYLHRIERIETDKETIRSLERIIPDMPAYFSDYF